MFEIFQLYNVKYKKSEMCFQLGQVIDFPSDNSENDYELTDDDSEDSAMVNTARDSDNYYCINYK